MKKYLDYILLGTSALFGLIILLVFLAPGITLLGATQSVYSLIGDSYGGLIVALIFVILGFLTPLCLCALKLLKIKFLFGSFVAAGAALLLLVAGILLFCTSSFVGVGALGAGAIIAGIFAILNTCVLCGYATTKLIK